MAGEAKVDPIPSRSRLMTAGEYTLKGMGAGVVSGLGMAIAGGFLGNAATGIVAGAILGGDAGKMVAVHHGIEAVQLLFVNGGQ